MAIRLIGIDLDDTLLDGKGNISVKAAEMIKKIKDKGVLVTLATGRMYSSALPYALKLNMELPLITYQGALVKNSLSGEVLYYKPLEPKKAGEIIDFFKSYKVHYHAFLGDNLCMEKLTPEGRDYINFAGLNADLVPDLRRKAGEGGSIKVTAMSYEVEKILEMEKILKRNYEGELHITRSRPYFLDVLHVKADKAEALKVVAEHYGIKQEEVMAIGDSYNDIPMLRWAGIGVAMGNAPEEVKKEADYVTFSNEEEGVAYILEKLILR
ncbi:Cof-type HAD-IIB family hydrolase [Thermosyntropha sp.]|uniref:Cof-type HAD-IIB family hydrolase n=1 Tax=Thermosyntropha sp. TaxID=2740820 RepID=UPI0025D17B63|nr:Cof-type HAD-IIB family hydrolase [Thermosyntropha sp.]MBO8159010.1 HAD family phosphatase [Thermosyntropha sp.]